MVHSLGFWYELEISIYNINYYSQNTVNRRKSGLTSIKTTMLHILKLKMFSRKREAIFWKCHEVFPHKNGFILSWQQKCDYTILWAAFLPPSRIGSGPESGPQPVTHSKNVVMGLNYVTAPLPNYIYIYIYRRLFLLQAASL